MTPGGQWAAAIEVLDQHLQGGPMVDRLLAQWGRDHRFAGARDRAAIADLVYTLLRRRAGLAARAGCGVAAAGARDLALGLAAEQERLAEIFSGVGHAPPTPTEAELARLAAPLAPSPEIPDWLHHEWPHPLGDWLCARAPVDLRVNRLKASLPQAVAALAADGVTVEPLTWVPDALRLVSGHVLRSRAFADGLVEVQDACAQATAHLAFVAMRAGGDVLDYCAGGGGKTLALGALMRGRGRLAAHDIDPRRTSDLAPRARRAGCRVWPLDPRDQFDLVFVDAPCSGSGAWRRNPDAKWRLTPERLAALNAAQLRALEGALRHLRPGGVLAYVTCSVLVAENAALVARFRARHPGLVPLPLAPLWTRAGLGGALPTGTDITFHPLQHGSDGFYLCLMRWHE